MTPLEIDRGIGKVAASMLRDGATDDLLGELATLQAMRRDGLLPRRMNLKAARLRRRWEWRVSLRQRLKEPATKRDWAVIMIAFVIAQAVVLLILP